MSLELIIVIIAVITVVALAGWRIAGRRATGTPGGTPNEAGQPAPLDGARDVLDRSVGMYVMRRMAGRPTSPPPEPGVPASALSTDEVAYRIGASNEPVRPPSEAPVPPAEAGAAATAAAARAAASASPFTAISGRHAPNRVAVGLPVPPSVAPPPTPPVPAAPRARLIRDAGVVLVGLMVVALVAILVWPGGFGPQTGVAGDSRASATAPSATTVGLSTSSAGAPASAGATPAAVVTAPATAHPTATKKPTPKPKPTAKPTPKPTPKPTAAPTATPVPAPQASISVSAPCGIPGVTIQFTAAVTTATSYAWDFDDGTGSGRIVSHTFDGGQAEYSVVLTVTGPGGQDFTGVTIRVPC